MKEIKEITFTRNGREQTMLVELSWHDINKDFAHVRKANGKPFFGTTGYYNSTAGRWGREDPTVIKSYRGKVLVSNVKLGETK